jgi:hypothetical protein
VAFKAQPAGRRFNLAHIQDGAGTADIGQNPQPAQVWHKLAQNFQSLGCKISLLERQPSDVAARSRQARDKACANRVASCSEDDGDDRCRLLCRPDCCGPRRDNDINLVPDELSRDLGIVLGASRRPANLDRDVAAVDPAEAAQPLHECGGPMKACPSQETRWSAASPAAARAPRAATHLPRRRAA